jgi:hypothetical protein
MVATRGIAAFVILSALLASPFSASAQIDDLGERAEELTAEVRASAANFRPLYEDLEPPTPVEKHPHRARSRRGKSREAIKPGPAGSKDPAPHAAPADSSPGAN